MPWSDKQKQLFVRACSAIGLNEAQRHMVLSGLPNAVHGGRTTSTSPKLTQADFEHAMACLEDRSGGQLKVRMREGGPFVYGMGHWRRQADDTTQRHRDLARRIATTLEVDGHLQPDGAGLAGWIRKLTGDGRERLDQLTRDELYEVIEGLKSYGRRKGVRWQDERKEAAC